MKKFLSIIFLLTSMSCLGQDDSQVSIANDSIELCNGFLVDTGFSAADYGNNEDFTMTICPIAPDSILNLYFNIFDLGAGDTLTLYDGGNESAPLIGVYTGGEIQSQDITSSESNASGCITVKFTSDASEVGNFAAEVSCGAPCERPFAIVETSEDPTDTIRVCVGEEIEFDGTSSTFAEGQVLESYTWEWGDGEETTTGGLVQTYSYDSPGDYKVNLFLVDDNNCANNNLTERIILVSTPPSFEGTSEDVIACAQQEVDLHGEVTGTTWDGTPDIDLGGALFIPDDQTQCFQTEVTFNSLIPGAVFESPDDIDEIFINFEHSFMGDLSITLFCPSGESIALHQQGGGGTFLGEPIDNDAENNPGVGYDYYWSPDATNGTWEEESTGVTTLPSGTYSAVGDWSNLEGCPLNGTWELEICDLWGIDNGFIFDWTVGFDPSVFADLISFTPTFGAGCDSTYWTFNGQNIDGSNGCNDITVSQDEPGTYEYIFNGLDNFGCSYSDTVNVQIEERPEVELDEDSDVCGDEIFPEAEILNENNVFEDGYEFGWSPEDMVDPTNTLTSYAYNLDGTTDFYFSINPIGFPDCVTMDTITVEIDTDNPVETELQSVGNIDCPGDSVQLTAEVSGGFPQYSFQWVNLSTGNVVGTETSVSVAPQNSTVYQFIVSDQCDSYLEEIEIIVDIPEPLSVENEELCVGTSGQLNISGGSGSYFLNSDLLEFENPTQPDFPTDNAGIFEILIVDQCAVVQPVTALVEIYSCSIDIPNIFTPNGDGKNDALSFEGLLNYPSGSTLIVKNRWGKEVYFSSSYKNDWSPRDLPEGTYYYILKVPTEEEFAGYINLTR